MHYQFSNELWVGWFNVIFARWHIFCYYLGNVFKTYNRSRQATDKLKRETLFYLQFLLTWTLRHFHIQHIFTFIKIITFAFFDFIFWFVNLPRKMTLSCQLNSSGFLLAFKDLNIVIDIGAYKLNQNKIVSVILISLTHFQLITK